MNDDVNKKIISYIMYSTSVYVVDFNSCVYYFALNLIQLQRVLVISRLVTLNNCKYGIFVNSDRVIKLFNRF